MGASAGTESDCGDFSAHGYLQSERTYHVERKSVDAAPLAFSLQADAECPIVNPAFVVVNWGAADVEVKLDGTRLERGKTFRFGHRHTSAGTDLIVWLEIESNEEWIVLFEEMH